MKQRGFCTTATVFHSFRTGQQIAINGHLKE